MLIQVENSVLFMQSFLWTIPDQCVEHHFEQASQTRTDIVC